MMAHLNLAVIACPSLKPELEQLAADGAADISIQFLEMALHERSTEALRKALQNAIDETSGYDAIAIGYGLCNRGIIGVEARNIPLVIPRTHDCIGLLLGSTKRYLSELDHEPGTYFQSAGWLLARDQTRADFTFDPASNASFERLAVRYGDEAAHYLLTELEAFIGHYKRLAFIAPPAAGPSDFEAEARAIAARKGLAYHHLDGDTGWLRRLLEGVWSDAEFLVVKPRQRVVRASGDGLIAAV